MQIDGYNIALKMIREYLIQSIERKDKTCLDKEYYFIIYLRTPEKI